MPAYNFHHRNVRYFEVLCNQLLLSKFLSYYLSFGVSGSVILVSLVEKLRNAVLWATQKVAGGQDSIQVSTFIANCLVILSRCQEIQDPRGWQALLLL